MFVSGIEQIGGSDSWAFCNDDGTTGSGRLIDSGTSGGRQLGCHACVIDGLSYADLIVG